MDIDEAIKDSAKNIKEMMSDADKYYVETFEKIDLDTKDIRGLVKDSVKTKEK